MGYEEIWKYLPSRQIKHLFKTSACTYSVCGVTFWYNDKGWKSDQEGLKKRRKCLKCVRLGDFNA